MENSNKVNYNEENCCWICEGWMESEFKLDIRNTSLVGLEISDNAKDEHYNFFIHFDFDSWEGDLLDDMRNQSLAFKGRFH